MDLLQAVLVGLTALIIAPGYLFYFDVTPKLVVLLAGAAAGALLWSGARASRPVSVVLAAAAVWLVVASTLSVHPALSFFGSTWRRFGAVAQLAVLLVAWLMAGNGARGRTVVLRGIAASSAIAAAYGIAQYFGWDPLLPKTAYHIGEGVWTIVRPPGTMGYVSYFATVLLMGGFVSLSMARSEAAPRVRRLAWAAAALCFAAMTLTGTRAALLGLAAGVAAAGFLGAFRVSRRILAAAGLVALVTTAFYFSGPGAGLRSRARWFREDPWGGARPLLWRDSLRMGLARPFTGFGPEVFTGTFPQFESRELARAYPDFAHESPHNIFLDAFVSQGLLGLACLAALCAMGLVGAWRARRPWLGAALAAAMVAQQFTAFTIPTALMFYAIIALSVAGAWPARAPLRTWPARVPAAALAAALLYLAFRYAAADRHLELAARQMAAGDAAQAQSEYRRYRSDRFPGASADLWYARSLWSLSQKGDPIHRLQALWMARAASLEATAGVEAPFNAWYSLAEVSAALNDPAQTEASLRHAIAANPTWFKPHWVLAEFLRMQGRTSPAFAEAATAADLDGGKHPEVTQTLADIRALHQ